MKFHSKSLDETENFAAEIALELQPGDILALEGGLGAGKTAFTKCLARGLKIPESTEIGSPTFVVIREYRGRRLPLYHFDFYRLESEQEAIALDLEENFD